ncbi:MAG: alpha/beta fold hydrolase [Clostridia bacterium]|nr:alpha/beta fold hydrolase [Clostridia bacterium]
MYITEDGIRLNACIERPTAGPEKCPMVVVIHGFTGHMEERHILAVSKRMNELGFATLRVDMYGHGHSDGEFRRHTLYKWLTNALTVIDYARGLDFVTDLYLCGHSQGGLTVMLAAALKHDVIKGVIPLSPACMIPEMARKGELLGKRFDPDHIPDTLESWDGRLLDGNYVRVAQAIDVERAIDRYAGPVLIVHGDEDEAVPVEFGKRAAAAYRNAQLVLIPGDNHCYDRHLDRAVDAVGAWLKGRLKADAAR